jgi:hypothetical protein
MARGWESKSVEAQQDLAKQEPVRPDEAPRKKGESPEELARRGRITSLELSRTRTLDQLETAAQANHRQILLRALNAIESELETLKQEKTTDG